MYGKLALATLSLAAITSAFPHSRNVVEKRLASTYTFYEGDGSVDAGWPPMTSWATFDELWDANQSGMQQSCSGKGWGADDTAEEMANIRSAIEQVSGTTGVDKRFIFAVVMQESGGCVRAPTSNNGVNNPGLMQSHNGAGTCDGVSPCPAEMITQMITEGTAGTGDGDGLQQTYATAEERLGGPIARTHYTAARIYNSGSPDWENLNNGLGSTACYAVDVANRLMGWSDADSDSTCPL